MVSVLSCSILMEFGVNMSSHKINTLLSLVNLTPSLYNRYTTRSDLTCKYSAGSLDSMQYNRTGITF